MEDGRRRSLSLMRRLHWRGSLTNIGLLLQSSASPKTVMLFAWRSSKESTTRERRKALEMAFARISWQPLQRAISGSRRRLPSGRCWIFCGIYIYKINWCNSSKTASQQTQVNCLHIGARPKQNPLPKDSIPNMRRSVLVHFLFVYPLVGWPDCLGLCLYIARSVRKIECYDISFVLVHLCCCLIPTGRCYVSVW